MPEQRLEKARESLPIGYQFGDAAPRADEGKSYLLLQVQRTDAAILRLLDDEAR